MRLSREASPSIIRSEHVRPATDSATRWSLTRSLWCRMHSLSISEGAIQVMGWQSCTDPKSYTYATLRALHEGYGLPLDTPIDDLSADMKSCCFTVETAECSRSDTRGREAKASMTLYGTALWTMLSADTRRPFLIRQRQSMSSLCALLRVRAVRAEA
mgnify:CR=1 FL=1